MLHVTERVNGAILWANLHLLFWLSLIPFVTGWMGENNFAPAPTALYGVVLLAAAIAYWILQRVIIAEQGEFSLVATAVGRDLKGKLSPLLYSTRHSGCVPASMDLGWYLRARGAHLAHPGPPHRAGSSEARPARGRVANPARDALPKDVAAWLLRQQMNRSSGGSGICALAPLLGISGRWPG